MARRLTFHAGISSTIIAVRRYSSEWNVSVYVLIRLTSFADCEDSDDGIRDERWHEAFSHG